MIRFIIKKENISGDSAIIEGSEFRHIVKVCRYKLKDRIILTDLCGYEYKGMIENIFRDSLSVSLIEKYDPHTEADINIDLYQAVIKKDNFELVIQKATELGVNNIYPVITSRCEKTVSNPKVLKRWNDISEMAASQSGRVKSSLVHKVTDIEKAVKNRGLGYTDIVLSERVNNLFSIDKISNKREIRKLSLWVGPEGSFTDDELGILKESNFVFWGLGKRILRSETAAITGLSVLYHIFGEF
jgi:16S rRNA (uracil1498-N3)-methyltransferase